MYIGKTGTPGTLFSAAILSLSMVAQAAPPNKAKAIAIETGSDEFEVLGFINGNEVIVEYPEVRHVSLTIQANVDVPDDLARFTVAVVDGATRHVLQDIEFNGPRIASIEFDATNWRLRGINAGGADLTVKYSYTVIYPQGSKKE